MSNEEKAKQVFKNCVDCSSQDVENCKSVQDGLITDCIGAIVPTDEELALLAGAGRKAIEDIIYPTNIESFRVAQRRTCSFCNDTSLGCVKCDFSGYLIEWIKEPIRRCHIQRNLDLEGRQDIQSESKPE